jgi:uncharacterized repeat protein (TIGR01451 family)
MRFLRASLLICGIALAANAQTTDVSILKTGPLTVTAGNAITYSITVSNVSATAAANVSWSDVLPPIAPGGSFQVQQTAGPTFTCTPGAGTVTCTIASLAVGTNATFTIIFQTPPSAANGSIISNTATVTSSTTDSNPANNSSTTNTTVDTSADLSVAQLGPSFAAPGTDVVYQVFVRNNGPSSAAVTLNDVVTGMTIVIAGPMVAGPFTCTNTSTSFTCSTPSLPPAGQEGFSVVAHIPAGATAGSTVTNTAALASTTPDPNPADNTSVMTTTVSTNADLSVTKTGPATTLSNTTVAYDVTLTNLGPVGANAVTLTDTVPAGLTFASAAQTPGFPTFTCTTPPVGGTGTITCTTATLGNGNSGSFHFVFNVPLGVPAGTVVTNTATSSSTNPDPNPANNTSSVTTTVGASIPALSPSALAALALMLAAMALVALKR